MPRLNFGAFLAPHHPVGEHPMLQFRRDLDLVEQLDRLGYDEFWCGEHHSSGWEMIGSPEMFLAAAGERSKRIKLATGVVSLPYHHPFNVAQRMVQLDWMTGGRAIFGSGPGALASDAHTLGIDPMVQRDRQDEAIGIIRRLFNGERVTAKSDWFTLQDAALQLLPLQEEMPFAVASQISPSGMTLAGKHGIGIISIGSMSSEGLNALPTQWGFAEAAAAKHGKTVDRKNWRVLLSWHIAETREKARAEAREGLLRHHNQYVVGTLQRPDAKPFKDPDEAVDKAAFSEAASATIGTPDDLVARIKSVLEISGGFEAPARRPLGEADVCDGGHGGTLRDQTRAMLADSLSSGSVVRKASSISRASSAEVSRKPRARTLAPFQRRAPRAVSASVHRAARTPGTLLAAIDTPVPVQQHTTPRSARPEATSSPTARPASGQAIPSPSTRTSWPAAVSSSLMRSQTAEGSSVAKAMRIRQG